MTFKFKVLIGVYIFSILLFSGVSRASSADLVFASFEQDPSPINIGFADSTGRVFELNGDLYFESENNETLLVHSSNFKFFRNLELPVDIQANAVITLQQNSYSSTLRTIRFVTNTIQKGVVL